MGAARQVFRDAPPECLPALHSESGHPVAELSRVAAVAVVAAATALALACCLVDCQVVLAEEWLSNAVRC